MSPGTSPHTNDGQMMKWPTSRHAQGTNGEKNKKTEWLRARLDSASDLPEGTINLSGS